jgi:hypothetical protein
VKQRAAHRAAAAAAPAAPAARVAKVQQQPSTVRRKGPRRFFV